LPKLGALLLLLVLLIIAGYFLDWSNQWDELNAARAKEDGLRSAFLDKKRQAINLDAYRKQLADIEQSFGAMLKQLPNRSEMEALLSDINQAGLGRGLQFDLFKPASAEIMSDFYAELPIQIKLIGNYHDVGAFASDVSQLSRIVTLNNLALALDKDGMLPDALEAACRTGTPAALYCMPSFQNPTAALMPEARRRQIADIAIRHNLMVIEDDVYGFLAPDAKPLSTFLPESQFLFITSTSKSIAPGIRIGYLLAPSAMIERLSVAVLRTVVNAAPAMAELATSLITAGVASRIVEWKRKEIAARQEIAQRVLQGLSLQTHAQSPHIWVRLPEPWQTDAFITRARHRGIMLTGADSFAVGHETDLQAIRIAIGPPATRSALEEGLSELVQMVHHVPEAYELVV